MALSAESCTQLYGEIRISLSTRGEIKHQYSFILIPSHYFIGELDCIGRVDTGLGTLETIINYLNSLDCYYKSFKEIFHY